MAATTTSTGNNLLAHYFVPKAILTLYAETPIYEFAVKAPQPKGQGNITYWNGWVALAAASSALSEGGSNTAVALSSRRVSATVAQYGRGVQITDIAEWTYSLNAREGAMQTLTQSAKETLERVCQMGIYKNSISKNAAATTNLSSYISSLVSGFCATTGTHNGDIQFQFPAVFGTSCARLSAVGKTAPSTSAQLSVFSIRKAVRKLRAQNAKPMSDGFYVGYAHPYALHTLSRDQTWINWNQYQNSKETMYKGEVGKTVGVRWISSTLSPVYRVAAHSVNMSFIFGQQAFGVTEVLGGLQMYTVEGPDSNNPYNTYAMITYKISAAAAALNPSAGVILFTHDLA
jgi:N4-gp56 family major capsid protein